MTTRVPHGGAMLRYAHWNVAWTIDHGEPSTARIASALASWCNAADLAPAATGAALLNAVALRIALRMHGLPTPELEAFVDAAPHRSDSHGFGFCFVDPIVASLAAEQAVKIVHNATSQPAGATLRPITDLIAESHAVFGHAWPSKDSIRVLIEAVRRGIPVTRLTDHTPVHRLGDGSRQATFFKVFTHRTPHLATVLTTSKITTTTMLARLGFPVPANQIVHTLEQARAFASRIGYPVVVKPNAADFGRGVTADIRGEQQLATAFALARSFGDALVEQHVAGENYRLLVVDGVCRGVNHRVQPSVTGDGVRTIAALMTEQAATLAAFPRADEPTVAGFLAGFGRRLDDVPPRGERVRISAVANASAGGTRVDVTDHVHADNKRLAESVAAVFGIDVAGIDLITPDITRPWREVGGAINEVNVNPGLPFPGAPGWVLDGLFPDGSNGRVDVSVIVGELSAHHASVITEWVRRSRMPASRTAVLGKPVDDTGRRHPLDPAEARTVVNQLLARPHLESLVVQAAWAGSGSLVIPTPYQARVLVNLDAATQAAAIRRLRDAFAHDPATEVGAFDIRAFTQG